MRRGLVLLAGLLTLGSMISVGRQATASPNFPTVVVDHGPDELAGITAMNRDGSVVRVGFGSGLLTEGWLTVPGGLPIQPPTHGGARAPAPTDGNFAWSFIPDTTTAVRYDLVSGEIIEIPLTLPAPGGWYAQGVVGSGDGSVLALSASNGALARGDTFLFSSDGTNLAPGPRGISTGIGQTSLIDISPAGTYVTFRETDAGTGGAGWQPSRYVRWDRSTGVRTTLGMPTEHDLSGHWGASVDLAWTTFFANGQLHRREVTTGATESIPAAGMAEYQLTRGGRVLYAALGTVADGTQETHIYIWDVGGEPQLVTANATGGAVDHAVEDGRWLVSQDGRRLLFTSWGTNHVSGTAGLARRMYLTTLSPLQLPPLYPNDGAAALPPVVTGAIPPEGQQCPAVSGAAPGDSVVVNVTPVNAGGAGFGTIHSSNEPAGATSNTNFSQGTTDPNVALAEVGADGRICFTNSRHTTVDVIIDQLVTAPAGGFTLPTESGAARLMDTRIALGASTLAPSATACVAAVGAEPGDYAVVNVTPILATGAGFSTVHSSDEPASGTSNANFSVGSVDPNVAFAKVGANGQICVTNSKHASVDLILDQLSTASAQVFSLPAPTGAVRLMDTRTALGATTLAGSSTACVAAAGAEPGDWAVVNVTPINAVAPGFGTVHTSDVPAGATSNVNFAPGTVDPNVAITEVGVDGRICFTNSRHGGVDVVIDQLLTGSPDAFAPPTPTGAARLVDTRS